MNCWRSAPAFVAAFVIDVFLVDFITHLFRLAAQFSQLVLDVLLVFGGDASVDGDLGFIVFLRTWLYF